jgi:hypothetical protein
MLKNKPTVTKLSSKWPTEKGIYSQSGMIAYLKPLGYNEDAVLSALNMIQNDKKSEVEYIKVKNFVYKESYPYYYIGLSKEEASKIKEEYEEKNDVSNKSEPKKAVAAKKEVTKKVAKKAVAGKGAVKKVVAKKAVAKKVAKKIKK